MDEEVSKKEAEEFTQSINGIYRCISALSASGINELFECVGRTLLIDEKNISGSVEKDLEEIKTIKIIKKAEPKKTKEKSKRKFC